MVAWSDNNPYQVTKWDAREIVGVRETECFTKTFTYSREDQRALIVFEPTHLSSLGCSGEPLLNRALLIKHEGELSNQKCFADFISIS